jgi:hypothetical protein
VREEAKQLNTSINLAVMQARAEEENFSMRITLGVCLGSEAIEPQRRILNRLTCESWCKNKSLHDDLLSSNDKRHQQEPMAAEIFLFVVIQSNHEKCSYVIHWYWFSFWHSGVFSKGTAYIYIYIYIWYSIYIYSKNIFQILMAVAFLSCRGVYGFYRVLEPTCHGILESPVYDDEYFL